MTPDGKITDKEWTKGLLYPTGMVLDGDKLYVVERRSVAVVDVTTGQIDRRLAIPQGVFLNDIARDAAGNLYVSDSQKHVIWRHDGEEFSAWLEVDSIRNPNGLLVHDGKLLVGCGGDSSLKAVDLAGKTVTSVVRFPQGVIDGIKPGPDGRYLVSIYEGKLYAVAPDGQTEKLLDTSAPGERLADFDYIPAQGLLLVPTLEDGLVKAFQLKVD
jgi:sugar lactone lactonase YvrE